jgi:uncharacterized protein YdaU (DUF1376 family)
MSRAWIAFYMGDYDKDTQALSTIEHGAYFLLLKQCWVHGVIPVEPAKRANIAKMSLRDWNKIAPTINSFFNEDGTQKRATKEIEKAEHIRLKRAIAGQRGGIKSGVSKAIRKGMDSKYQANANQTLRQNLQHGRSPAEPNHNSKLESSLAAAREVVGKFGVSDGSLATAHPEGALREPSSAAANHLLESLERLRLAKQSKPIEPEIPSVEGKIWIDQGTTEWSAHEHYAQTRKIRPRLASSRTEDGVVRTGAYFDCRVPPGYDEATGERIAPKSEDAA